MGFNFWFEVYINIVLSVIILRLVLLSLIHGWHRFYFLMQGICFALTPDGAWISTGQKGGDDMMWG